MSSSTQGTALITGGAIRIGAQLALFLSDRGYKIVVHYNQSKDKAQLLKDQIESKGGHCELFGLDLSQLENIEASITKIYKRHPDINVLINNASIFHRSPLTESNLKSLESHFQINFFAPYILSQCFNKNIRQGHIINILDTKIRQHTSPFSTYLLSKKSLEAFTLMSSLEYAPEIRVNAIAPGLILPPEGEDDEYLKKRASNIPLKQHGNLKNIEEALHYLLRNPFVTGQILYCDGGEHLITN